jgi:hypothetical protein
MFVSIFDRGGKSLRVLVTVPAIRFVVRPRIGIWNGVTESSACTKIIWMRSYSGCVALGAAFYHHWEILLRILQT